MKLPWQKSKNKAQEIREQYERLEWLKEIEPTRGYRLIVTMIAQNEQWLQQSLENMPPITCLTDEQKAEYSQYQSDLRSVRQWKYALTRWDAEGDKAREILFGRTGPIDNKSFGESAPNTNQPN